MKKRVSQTKKFVYVSSPKRFYPETVLVAGIVFLLFFSLLTIIAMPLDKFGIFIMSILLLLSLFITYVPTRALIIELNKKRKQLIIKNYFASKLNLKRGIKIINLRAVSKDAPISIVIQFHKYSRLKPIIDYLKKHFRGKVIIKYIPDISSWLY